MLRLLLSTVAMNLLFMKLWRGKKKFLLVFTAELQAAKVMPTVCDNCFIKREKALSLYKKIFWESERQHLYINITVYCYNCPIFIIAVVNLLMSLIYKLNFITGIHIWEKNNIYKGFDTIYSCWHPLRVMESIPCRWGGRVYYIHIWSSFILQICVVYYTSIIPQ